MIGGCGDLTRSHIDLGGVATFRHHARRQNVVYAPAAIPLEGVAEEIPVGVLNDIGVKFAEDIDESPGDGLFVGVSRSDVEVDIVDALFRMVDVDRLRGDF